MPLPHRQEIRRLAIAAPNVNAGTMLEKLSKHHGMVAPSSIRKRGQA
jgi:hypothetical protein